MARRCNPHRWDVEKWLPIRQGADIETALMTCLNCGRELRAEDTSPNMRASIAHGIATRLYEGDEYEEVYRAVSEWFVHHLNKYYAAKVRP